MDTCVISEDARHVETFWEGRGIRAMAAAQNGKAPEFDGRRPGYDCKTALYASLCTPQLTRRPYAIERTSPSTALLYARETMITRPMG